MQEIEIRGEYVTLGQLLKILGLVGTGGETKWFLDEVPILVNGEQDNRRGRKLRVGDVVEIPEQDTVTLVAAKP